MGKLKRGKTTKISIKLSKNVREVHTDGTVTGTVATMASNLGISSAGVILFELPKLLADPPSLEEIKQMESEIELADRHFVLTVNNVLLKKIDALAKKYNMTKMNLMGYIISSHFEKLQVKLKASKELKPQKTKLLLNKSVKKKMTDYCEENFLSHTSVITYSILQGPNYDLPTYDSPESESVFVSIPSYLVNQVKTEAAALNIAEHFYLSLCLYKQFMTAEGRFYKQADPLKKE